MKVISEKIPCYHYYAQCRNCNFTDGASHNGDITRVRNNVKKHVLKTGHEVSIEKGNTIIYKRI